MLLVNYRLGKLCFFISEFDKLGQAYLMASRFYGRTILGMGKSASKPAYSIFPIGHFREIVDFAMVYSTDYLATHNYIFLLYGLRLECFDKYW